MVDLTALLAVRSPAQAFVFERHPLADSLHLLMASVSGFGTNAKCRPRRAMSEFEAKAEDICSG
jgi:hypothetical protein